MVGSKVVFKAQRIPASSLLEVVVSLLIIIIVFSVATMIYSNLARQATSDKQVIAYTVLQGQADKMRRDIQMTDARLDTLGIRFVFVSKIYAANDRLKILELKAYDGDRKISEIKKLVIR